MFNTLSHKGNANQNFTDILSHPSHIGNHQGNKQQLLVRIRGKENYQTVLMRM
jgi:hypothetical protein